MTSSVITENRPAKSTLVLHLLVLGLVVASLYARSLSGPLLLDDSANIAENSSLRSLWGSLTPERGSMMEGRPLVNFTFALNYALSGVEPFPYRLVNLGFHLLNAGIVYMLVRWLVERGWNLEPARKARMTWFALAASLLWAIHPMQASAVAYISQRTELVAATFYLISVLCAVTSWSSARPVALWLLSLVSLTLGGFAKETVISAPLVVLMLDWLISRRLGADTLRRRMPFYFALFGVVALHVWRASFYATDDVGGIGRMGVETALVHSSATLAMYAQKFLVPINLCFDYGIEVIRDWRSAPFAIGATACVFLAAVYFCLRGSRVASVGLIAFLLLAPTTSLAVVLGQPVAEHRMYLASLPLVGLSMAALFGLGRWRMRTIAVLLLATFAVSVTRLELFRDEEKLTADTLQKAPNNGRLILAQAEAAEAKGERGRAETLRSQAIAAYRQVSTKDPLNARALRNLGLLLTARPGGAEEAADCLSRLVKIDPSVGPDYFSLGNALSSLTERRAEAIAAYEKADALMPDSPLPRTNLGGLLCETKGRRLEGMKMLREVIARFPNHAPAFATLAIALARTGSNWAEPESLLEQAVLIDPKNALLHYNLGLVLSVQNKDVNRVVQCYQKAIELKPAYIEAHYNLGLVFFKGLHESEKAMECFARVLELDPNNRLAQVMMDKIASDSLARALAPLEAKGS